jgi:hypothetical protein
MFHFEVEKTNPNFFKKSFKFFSNIPEFQVGGPVNQQIKNMWPYQSCNVILESPIVHMANKEPAHFIRYAALASIIPNYLFSKVVFS